MTKQEARYFRFVEPSSYGSFSGGWGPSRHAVEMESRTKTRESELCSLLLILPPLLKIIRLVFLPAQPRPTATAALPIRQALQQRKATELRGWMSANCRGCGDPACFDISKTFCSDCSVAFRLQPCSAPD